MASLVKAAMTCSHAESMGATLLSKLLDVAGTPITAYNLSGPLFIEAWRLDMDLLLCHSK